MLSSPARISIAAGSVALLGLLSAASAAEAAPGYRRASEICDAHTTAVRKLPRHPKSFGGPVAHTPRGLIRLADLTHRLQRGTRANLNDDDAAIQNDAPAARIAADERPTLGLRPLGVLLRPLDLHALTRAFSPRSPRGPPFSA